MNPDHEMDDLLGGLGEPLPPEMSVVDKVMDRLAVSQVLPSTDRKGNRIMKSGFGLAASVLVLLTVWLFPLSTPEITLADLRDAISREQWMHIKYDTGDELWILLAEHQSWHRDQKGNAEYHDHRRNIHRNWCPQLPFIMEDHLLRTALGPPTTPLEAINLPLEWLTAEEADLPSSDNPLWMRSTETAEGRQLVRFDFFGENSLKERIVKQQLWVDPQTKLPIRVRQRQGDGSYREGRYTFPQTGPRNLADLGVPTHLPVRMVSDQEPASEPKIVQILKTIDQAIERFPTCYRAVIWGEEMQVLYQDGPPVWDQGGFDWFPVKLCRLRYDALETRPWELFGTPQPWNILINDGQRRVDYNTQENRIHIGPRGGSNAIVPAECFWPIGGTASMLDAPSTEDSGLIGMRFEGVNWRKDCWFDPAHDYIAIRQIEWLLERDGWRRTEEHRLSHLMKLPRNSWYPRVRTTTRHRPDAAPETIVTLFHIHRLGPNEQPLEQFDIDRLLKQARQQGAAVTSD